MVRKCCVTGSKSNYLSEKKKVTMYRNLRIWSHLLKKSFMENFIFLQRSRQFCEYSGIPKFSLKVKQDFTYNAYHMGVKCQISVLTKK